MTDEKEEEEEEVLDGKSNNNNKQRKKKNVRALSHRTKGSDFFRLFESVGVE